MTNYHFHSFSNIQMLTPFLKNRPAGEQIAIISSGGGSYIVASRPDPYDNSPLVAGMKELVSSQRELGDLIGKATGVVCLLITVLIAAVFLF